MLILFTPLFSYFLRYLSLFLPIFICFFFFQFQLLIRVLWAAHSEDELHTWFSSNYNVEVHAYVKNGKYCVVNNTYEPQDTTVYRGDGSSFALHLDANEIKWYSIA